MDIETSVLNSKLSRAAESKAIDAELAERNGDHRLSIALYAEAAAMETELVLGIDKSQSRLRGVLAISAVSLWLRAELFGEGIRRANELIEAGGITEDGAARLRELILQCRKRELPWDEEDSALAEA